jgi:glutamyl-tRNA reductase
LYLQLHEAECYIYRVACGLESLVLGEAQIIGQLGAGITRCKPTRLLFSVLTATLYVSNPTGRAAQHHTHIGRHSTSVAHIAVTAIQHTLETTPPRVMLWGAGEIAQLSSPSTPTPPYHVCHQ